MAGADLRDLCPDRHGRLTPACIVDTGHLLVEKSAFDFTHQATAIDATDTVAAASTTLRFGVRQHLEILAVWTPYVHQRMRTLGIPGAAAARTKGIGDVTLGLKQPLLDPDSKTFSLALQSFVVIPTANAALDVGSVVEGLIVPITYALPANFALGPSPEIDRIANAGAGGHRTRCTFIGGLSRQFGAVSGGVELAGVHDDDPTRRTTKATFDVFAAYISKALPSIQFDAATYIAVNHDTPDVAVLNGVSKRF